MLTRQQSTTNTPIHTHTYVSRARETPSVIRAARLIAVLQGCSASRQVWDPHEAHEVLACMTFQSIAWLVSMLMNQPYKRAW